MEKSFFPKCLLSTNHMLFWGDTKGKVQAKLFALWVLAPDEGDNIQNK